MSDELRFKEGDRVRDPETGLAGEIDYIIHDEYYVIGDDQKHYIFSENSRWTWKADTGPCLGDIYKLQCETLRRLHERWSR